MIVGPDPSYSPSRSTSAKENENQRDPRIRTECRPFGGATCLIFVVDGGNSVGFTVIRSPISWNMVVPLGNRTEMYEFMRMSTLHFVLFERSVVDSASLKNVQQKRSSQTVKMFLGGHEKHLRSVRIFMRYSEKSRSAKSKRKIGVRQSVIFVAGHCVQCMVTNIHHEARRPSRQPI